MTTPVCFLHCTRDCGCTAHPAFPAPSLEGRLRPLVFWATNLQNSGTACRENAEAYPRHCEEPLRRSNPGVTTRPLDCSASLAMTKKCRVCEVAPSAVAQRAKGGSVPANRVHDGRWWARRNRLAHPTSYAARPSTALPQPEAPFPRQTFQEQVAARVVSGNTPNSPATSWSGFCLSAQCRAV